MASTAASTAAASESRITACSASPAPMAAVEVPTALNTAKSRVRSSAGR